MAPGFTAEPLARPDGVKRTLEIRFTGSGSEYFRIWVVNLLLILVTLGLYLPFAKARRIRYFYANTRVDGQALSFHGNPWKMFRGFALLVALMGVYSGAEQLSSTAGFIAFLILCAVWPALWRASLQFRLANTSWRGLRMRFDGTLKGAYLACAVTYLPTIALFGGAQLLAPDEAGPAYSPGWSGLYLLGALSVMLLTPWSLTLFKRYQHNGYRIARQRSHVVLGIDRVYLLSLSTLGIGIAAAFLALLAGGLLAGALVLMGGARPGTSSPGAQLTFLAFGLLFYVLVFSAVAPYGAARMQNLAWNGTRSEALRFVSRLRARDLFLLTLKNWLLTALTLGLYRPFAAVSTARLRLEAVDMACDEDPADWFAAVEAGHADASGDIAGDFFGIDMGL